MNNSEELNLNFKKFSAIKPRAIKISQEVLVKTGYLEEQKKIPLVLQPSLNNVNLVNWVKNNQAVLEEQLLQHGAILFRNFYLNSVPQFEQFARAVSSKLIDYGERSSPRTSITKGVYTSTDHPADQHIQLHNEQSYTLNWPMKILFFCLHPAQHGGRTPTADSRKIFKNLDPKITNRFLEKKVMYVRNYGDRLGLPWQEVFQTNDKAVVEAHCRSAAIEFEWKDNNRLRTRQIRQAIATHPKTGETVWFNHAVFFHVSSLEESVRQSMLAVVEEENFPFNTFYGDGSPIKPSVLVEIREAYRQETVTFPWRKGDVLMLDNMLMAHGREPFVGHREIVVAMADPRNTQP